MIEVALCNKIINEVRYLKYEEPDVDNQLLLFYN
jgi:hypothetical protein